MPLRCQRSLALFSLALVLSPAFFVCPLARASIAFQPVNADELKMNAEAKAPGAPAIILFRQVDRDDNGQTGHEDNYLRIKILTQEGRKYADVEIPFFKRATTVTSIKARTIRPDGSTLDFDGKVFEKTIAKAKGLKYLAKTFTLPDVQVGGIIEYAYTVDLSENFVFDSHWVLSQDLFTKKAKFSLKPYSSSWDRFSVRFSWQMLPDGTAPPKEGPDHIVRLEAQDIPAFQTEDFMPPENEYKARVDFIYSREAFEPDSDKFWRTQGKRLNDSLEDFIGKRKAMEQAVAQIVSAADSPSALLETKEPRSFPIEFDSPVRDTDAFEITLPEGFEVDDLPPPVDADFGFASYHSKTEAKGNVIGYTRTFEIKDLSVPANKAADLKKFYRIIAGDERNTAVLKMKK